MKVFEVWDPNFFVGCSKIGKLISVFASGKLFFLETLHPQCANNWDMFFLVKIWYCRDNLQWLIEIGFDIRSKIVIEVRTCYELISCPLQFAHRMISVIKCWKIHKVHSFYCSVAYTYIQSALHLPRFTLVIPPQGWTSSRTSLLWKYSVIYHISLSSVNCKTF